MAPYRLICFIVLLIFSLNSSSANADKTTETLKHYPMLETRMVQVDSVDTRYVDVGKGEVILLIHGFPETLQGWRKNVPELSKHFRVVALDLVGFGGSDKVDWGFSCERLSEFVKQFLDKLEIHKVHVVGGDTGALIALAFAANYPERVGKLVIFSGTAYPEGISAKDVKLIILPVIGDIGFGIFGSLGLRKGIERGFFEPQQIEDEIMNEYLESLSSWKSRKLALKLMRQLGKGADLVMAKLRENSPRTLILWAEHEKYFYSWVPERLKRDLENSELVYVKDSGHFIQEERPEIFNHKLVEFLERS